MIRLSSNRLTTVTIMARNAFKSEGVFYLVVYTWRGDARHVITAWKIVKMAKSDIRRYSLGEINAMRARGETVKTPSDAPVIELDETFWKSAKIVETKPR
ncbi:MAG: hypothetical protein WCD20_16820 [Rhodomicrobium sp.]